MIYINFYFKNLEHDGDWVTGTFESPDVNVYCNFVYNTITKEYRVSECSIHVEEAIPLPFWWLDKKLCENGKLNRTEARICY